MMPKWQNIERTLFHKAFCIYSTYPEPIQPTKLELSFWFQLEVWQTVVFTTVWMRIEITYLVLSFPVDTVVMCRLGWRHTYDSLAGNRSLKDMLVLLRLLTNLQTFFSLCIFWGINSILSFNTFWAFSETVFIRSSEAMQNIAFLCQVNA